MKNMTKMDTTQRIVRAALLAALTCVATMIIKIPSPLKGYLNLGDCVVLLAGWMLPPVYGALAAGLGSGLADLFLGYVVYAPATFVIKGLMALVAAGVYYGVHYLVKSNVIALAVAVILAVVVYFVLVIKCKVITESELENLPKGNLIKKVAKKLHLL